MITSDRTFPFSFSYNPVSDPTVFPVGDATYDFDLNVVILIYDSVNDPRQVIRTVKVPPHTAFCNYLYRLTVGTMARPLSTLEILLGRHICD